MEPIKMITIDQITQALKGSNVSARTFMCKTLGVQGSKIDESLYQQILEQCLALKLTHIVIIYPCIDEKQVKNGRKATQKIYADLCQVSDISPLCFCIPLGPPLFAKLERRLHEQFDNP